ncbi:MAG: hypothetical protein K8F62_14615 [Pseudorhodoplanes sp.]|nr:hypothetical protein [Pseudorhodoplanes sp.]
MFSLLAKGCAISAIALAFCLIVKGARAESYPSDTANAGVSQQTKAKPAKVKIRHVPQLVVHPNVSAKKSGK